MPNSEPARVSQADKIAETIVRDVAELPDRSSPDDWPEAMLVTAEELRLIVTRALSTPPASPGWQDKLRMIVSHATDGSSQDIDASVNDICVRISANRNAVYQRGKDIGLEDAAKACQKVADAAIGQGRRMRRPTASPRNPSGHRSSELQLGALRCRDEIHKLKSPAAPEQQP